MEASLINWKPYKSVRHFSVATRREAANMLLKRSCANFAIVRIASRFSFTKGPFGSFSSRRVWRWKDVRKMFLILFNVYINISTSHRTLSVLSHQVVFAVAKANSEVWRIAPVANLRVRYICASVDSASSYTPPLPSVIRTSREFNPGAASLYDTLHWIISSHAACGACYREAVPMIRCIYTGIYRRAITPLYRAYISPLSKFMYLHRESHVRQLKLPSRRKFKTLI